jgi:hypothetical protein
MIGRHRLHHHLDKNQWIGKAAGKDYNLPVLADAIRGLVCGAHPYKLCSHTGMLRLLKH